MTNLPKTLDFSTPVAREFEELERAVFAALRAVEDRAGPSNVLTMAPDEVELIINSGRRASALAAWIAARFAEQLRAHGRVAP